MKNNQRQKSIQNFWNVFKCTIIWNSLLLPHLSFAQFQNQYAQYNNYSGGMSGGYTGLGTGTYGRSTAMSGLNNILSTVTPIVGQIIQSQNQQNIQLQQMQQFAQGGTCPTAIPDANRDGMSDINMPSDYFPNCKTPLPEWPMAEAACSEGSIPTDPANASLQQIVAAQQQADCHFQSAEVVAAHYRRAITLQSKNFDQNFALPSANGSLQIVQSPGTTGVQCMEEQASLLAAQIQGGIERLKVFKAQAKQMTDKAKKDLQNKKREMINTNVLLGDVPPQNQEQKQALDNLSRMLRSRSPVCSEVIDNSAFNRSGGEGGGGERLGLRDLRSLIEAGDSNTSKLALANKLNPEYIKRSMEKVTDYLANGNVFDQLSSSSELQDIIDSSGDVGPGISAAIQKEVSNFNTRFNTLTQYIKRSVPDFPTTFDSRTHRRVQKLLKRPDLIEDNYVMSCILGEGDRYKNIGIDPEFLIKSIGQLRGSKKRNFSKNAIDVYKNDLRRILGEDARFTSTTALINAIKKLEKKNKNRYFAAYLNRTYKGKNSGYPWSLTELFTEVNKDCQTAIKISDATSGSDNGDSHFLQAKEAVRSLRDLDNEFSSYNRKMIENIKNRIINCSGRGYETNMCLSGEAMNPSSTNFCLSNAVRCQNATHNCNSALTQMIDETRGTLDRQSKEYNAMVVNYRRMQQGVLNQINGMISQLDQSLLNIFKDHRVKFQLPGNSEVNGLTIPDTIPMDFFGATIADGGQTNFLDNLDANIDALIRAMENQKDNVTQVAGNRIGQYKEQYSQQLQKWENFKDQCNDLASKAEMAQQEHIAAQNQKMVDQQDAFNEYCSQVSSFSVRPGCSEEIGEMMDSLTRMGGGAGEAYKLRQFQQYCAMVDNESDLDDEFEINCMHFGNDSELAMSYLKSEATELARMLSGTLGTPSNTFLSLMDQDGETDGANSFGRGRTPAQVSYNDGGGLYGAAQNYFMLVGRLDANKDSLCGGVHSNSAQERCIRELVDTDGQIKEYDQQIAEKEEDIKVAEEKLKELERTLEDTKIDDAREEGKIDEADKLKTGAIKRLSEQVTNERNERNQLIRDKNLKRKDLIDKHHCYDKDSGSSYDQADQISYLTNLKKKIKLQIYNENARAIGEQAQRQCEFTQRLSRGSSLIGGGLLGGQGTGQGIGTMGIGF